MTGQKIAVIAPDGEEAQLTLAERLVIAVELQDEGVALMEQNLRLRHPEADEATIQRLLPAWLADRLGAPEGDGAGRPIPWPPTTR